MGVSSGWQGTQEEGYSGVEEAVWGVEFSTSFQVLVGTQHRDARNADGYMYQWKPPKLLG